jgi:FtsP/CotA-like multicopper oxidase with cupredoxin domain
VFTANWADQASINQGPTTRKYTFNLGYSAGTPDGFLRSMMTINNQYPGPLIEANQGDKLEITVNNNLGIPQSIHWHGMRQNIHWHGMRQNGTNDQDGVPGVSQCAIPPGGSFTYRFSLDSEMGTYWYHSHYGNTMADGIVGGIIVHARNDPLRLGIDYDDERMVYLSDWMDD